MECNREEALRAKEIAERKFVARDMKGAKKFAVKAQNLYPELDGISQMVTTLEVYIAAEEKLNEESNWYGVLGVTPLADDESIRKQYRKLALLLHPDKNRSIGAEGAFQFLSQAWNLLSDKSKKTAYDLRCGRLFQQRNQNKNGGSSPAPAQNGFYNFANTASSQAKAQKGEKSKRKKERHTFWTVCHRCKMQYEYLRMYLNHNLLCPNCHEAYFAVEIDPPSTKSSKIPQMSNSHRRKKDAADASRNKSGNHHDGANPKSFQWVPFTEPSGAQSKVQAANMVKQAYEKVKRERQKAQAATRREEALKRKNTALKRTIGGESFRNSEASKRRKGAEDSGANKDKMNNESGTVPECESSRVLRFDIKHVAMEKARNEIQRKLKECISANVVRNVISEENHMSTKENETSTESNSIVTHGFMCKQKKPCKSLEMDKQMCMDVLEPDFHDFDKSRTENCFDANQVWAVYDDDDGMPRHYVMIRNVISRVPFKVSMSLLSSTTHNRLEKGSWFLSGFLRTYGEFKEGRHEICDSIDCFSHKVRWKKDSLKTILIFPRKGDVWALYRNWSPEWNELTEDKEMHKYDMVEVLEDCDEEEGVIIIPLVKVAGFKAVFRQHFDPSEIRRIPKEELSRFSHQVPYHLLTGREVSNSLKGCLELDPSAIPSQFLQLMSEIETLELMETDEVIETLELMETDEVIETAKPVECVGATSTELEKTVETIEDDETVKAVECDGLTATKMENTIELVETDEVIETTKAVEGDGVTSTEMGKTVEIDEGIETVKAVECDFVASTKMDKTIELVETDEDIETVKAVECDGVASTKMEKTIELVETDEDIETANAVNCDGDTNTKMEEGVS